MTSDLNIILSGIVGSTAYGLAGPDSDVDRLGIFAAPTASFHGLHPPTSKPHDSHVTSKPDATYHEARKACLLMLGGNPTVTEILWLPDELYEVCSAHGDALIDIRSAFLSAKRVRDAYLGYATAQFQRLEGRGDGSFSADTRKRTAKHARHLKRLLHQGLELYSTGRVSIRLDEPQAFHDFGERVAGGDLDAGRRLLAKAESDFGDARTPLPDYPDEKPIDAWLHHLRRELWEADCG